MNGRVPIAWNWLRRERAPSSRRASVLLANCRSGPRCSGGRSLSRCWNCQRVSVPVSKFSPKALPMNPSTP